jgi:multimeric flavodoxin WrbA
MHNITYKLIRRNVLKILVHDLSEQDFLQLGINKNDYKVINANAASAPCMGCFNCWFVTPGMCKINDYIQNSDMGNSEETILISQNCYGGYSEQVKKILDRSVPASTPFFTYRSWKVRHVKRHKMNRKQLTVILYGDFLEKEKIAARRMVEGNRGNLVFKKVNLHMINNVNEIGQVLK